MSSFDADELYDIVATYASFGNHHTGTMADIQTTAWLRDLLEDLDAEVREEPFDFDRFECSIDLRSNDQAVPALPLFYSAVGEWHTDQIDVVRVEGGVVGNAGRLPELLPEADPERALVLAIEGPDDLPVQCNRIPSELHGQPAVVVAANWGDRVEANAHLSFTATLQQGQSANVLAWLGDPQAPQVNITTPLTGWTPAAGERGTGLAVAIAMAVELASNYRVNFSACSGHELDHIGLRHHLAGRDISNVPAIHLGASIAATEPDSTGPAKLGDRRLSLTTATGPLRVQLGDRAADANWNLVDMDPWVGEGGTWREAGASVLSFLGGSSVFHTTADTISATSPQALVLAAEVAIDCAQLFLGAHQ